MTEKKHSLTNTDLILILVVALGAGALVGAGMPRKVAFVPARRDTAVQDDALNHAAKSAALGGYHIINPSVTIAAPPQDILALCKDPALLRAILGEEIGYEVDKEGNTLWRFGTGRTAFGPVASHVVHEREDALIVWRSLDKEGPDLEIKLRLTPAPGQRGTRVGLLVASKRTGLARLLPNVTEHAVRKALKGLKMLAEAGEIAIADNRRLA